MTMLGHAARKKDGSFVGDADPIDNSGTEIAANADAPSNVAIARNVAADHARHFWTRASVEQLTDKMPEQLADEEPRSDSSLADAMAQLPEHQRQAFSMVKLEGLSIEQAADRAGVSVGALRVRAHRAYKALRKLISE